MQKTILLPIAAIFIALAATGCTGTVKGIKHDAGNAYDAVKETIREIGK